MKATINGIELQGTPTEIAQYISEMKRIRNKRYSQEAQREMFNRQEGEAWRRS